jgi:hypothetical protein
MPTPNADIGQRTSQPLISQGTSPATTPGATTKKTALPTAAVVSLRTIRPYVRTQAGFVVKCPSTGSWHMLDKLRAGEVTLGPLPVGVW